MFFVFRRNPAVHQHFGARLLAIALLPLAIVIGSSSPARADYWKKIWGPVELFLANDSGEYAVKLPEKDIYQRRKGKTPEWIKIGGPGKEFAVTKDNLYGLTPDGGAIYEYSGTPGRWTQVGGAASHIYAGLSGLFATNPETGDLWAYRLTVWEDGSYRVRPNWTKVGGPGAMFALAERLQPSGYPRLYGLSPNRDSVWQYDKEPMKWEKIGGPAQKIWAAGTGVWATNPATGDIHGYRVGLYDRTELEWIRLGGPGLDFAVHQNGATLYGLGTDHKIRQFRTITARDFEWVILGQPHKQKFDRVFAGINYRNLKAREKGTKALWSLEEGNPPQRSRQPPQRDG
jgi:hypothetical protein